ncbi:MAG: hypothetical protein ABIT01_03005 [Thermoanaerobaculia bacterium]
MTDSIKISIQSTRLTLTADHSADDTEGIRQTLALLQTFLRSLLGESDGSTPSRTTRRTRSRAPEAAKVVGGAQ